MQLARREIPHFECRVQRREVAAVWTVAGGSGRGDNSSLDPVVVGLLFFLLPRELTGFLFLSLAREPHHAPAGPPDVEDSSGDRTRHDDASLALQGDRSGIISWA